MPEISRIVYEVLSQIGNHREAQYYLDLFNRDDPIRFALIAVDDSLIINAESHFGSAISFLSHLGLRPVIVHSGAISPNKIIKLLSEHEVGAQIIEQDLSAAHIDTNPISNILKSQRVPVLSITKTSECKFDQIVLNLATQIMPHKIILLSANGGLINEDGRVISSVNLHSKTSEFNAIPLQIENQILTLEQSRTLLSVLPSKTSISITNVQNLVTELFTYKGAGTLIRIEDVVDVYQHFDMARKVQLTELIKVSFRRKLDKHYFEDINLDKIFVSQSGSAMAVVLNNENNIAYLDKFVVTPQAQGIGLGKVIWQILNQHYSQIYWRARTNNPINSWYLRQADSSKRVGDWIVFGQNIESQQWQHCINDALSRTIYMVD